MFDNTNMFSQEFQPSKASTPAEFGQLFRAEREARGLTQADVAASAGVRRQTIGEMHLYGDEFGVQPGEGTAVGDGERHSMKWGIDEGLLF